MIILSKRIIATIICLSIILFPFSASANSISAESCIVIDADTSTILYEYNAYSPMEMASTTKIMTCLLACESGKLNNMVEITTEMLDGVYGSLIYLNVGDRITLLDLVRGAMLASGNDAANSIAVYVGGSVDDFVKMMNDRAVTLGMRDTVFVTPSGLDEGDHHSTAYDMAVLGAYAIKNQALSSICSKSSCEIVVNDEERVVYNHNKLLAYDDSFIGLKTGYTDRAGRCLVSAYDYEGNTIITVTLNAPNDWDDHKSLVKSVKYKYKHCKGNEIIDLSVVGGCKDSVECGYDYDAVALKDINVECYYYPFLYAPIKNNDKVGFAKIYINNELIKTVEITAKEDIELWQITK